MKEKTYVEDVNRSIYDIRNEEKDVYRVKEGLTPEIVDQISNPAHDFQRSFVIISRERIDHLCAEDDRDIRQNNLHERTENPTDDQPRVTFPDHGHNLFSHIAFDLINLPHNPHTDIIFTAFKSGHSFSAGRKTIHNIAPSLSSELHGFRTPPISHGRLTRSDRIF